MITSDKSQYSYSTVVLHVIYRREAAADLTCQLNGLIACSQTRFFLYFEVMDIGHFIIQISIIISMSLVAEYVNLTTSFK